jgi:hypothetical protein
VLTRISYSGIWLILALTVGACSTDNAAPAVEPQGDPEGDECVARGYAFGTELYRTCRNDLIEQHAKQKKPDGIY